MHTLIHPATGFRSGHRRRRTIKTRSKGAGRAIHGWRHNLIDLMS